MRIPSRAGAWVWAASSLLLSGASFGQPATPAQPIRAPVAGQENTPRPTGGRHQFSTPVMNMEIKGEGVGLPAGVAQPEEPIKPPAKPAEKPIAK